MLKIRKELQELFADCDQHQDEMLEQDIIENGCRDPILYWNDGTEQILVDGHRRFKICTENNIEYNTKEIKFEDQDEVIGWIYANQYQRRNLTDMERSDIRGRDYLRLKNPHGNYKKVSGQNDQSLESPLIRDELANKYKVSDATIRRDAIISQELQQIEDKIGGADGKEAKKNILKGNVNVNKKDIKELVKMSKDGCKDVVFGQKTVKEVKKEQRKIEKEDLLAKVKEEVKGKKLYKLFNCDMNNMSLVKKCDVIICDPPYPKEFIQEFHKLGKFAKDNLKDDGLLVCLTGQSYLPDYLSILSEYLTYHWTIAYLTPDKSCQIFPKKIFTNWKPLLVFTKGNYNIDWQTDVFDTSIYTKRDNHKWEQSIEGFNNIVDKFSKPGQIICDPFCGSGTTGIAAITQNRYFIGIDICIDSINTSEIRLMEASNDKTEE